MNEKTYSRSQYASMTDLLSDKCKDQQEKIQSLEAENAELHRKITELMALLDTTIGLG